MPFTEFDDIFNNIKKILGEKKQKGVAEKLGITSQAVTHAKSRGVIPQNWLDIVEDKYGVTKEELCETPEEKLVRTYGRNPVTSSVGIPWQSEPVNKTATSTEKDLVDAIDMPEMVKMTMEVLASDTDHRSALVSHIRTSHKAVNMEKEMNQLREDVSEIKRQNKVLLDELRQVLDVLKAAGLSIPEKRDKKAI